MHGGRQKQRHFDAFSFSSRRDNNTITRLFYKQHFYNQRQPEIDKRSSKYMLSNTLRLNLCYLKIIQILHRFYHPKNDRIYSKK